MTNRVIVKVQMPLSTNVESPPFSALIYDQARTVMVQQRLLPADEKVMDDRPKVFFFAELRNGGWILQDEAPWQNW